MQVLATKEKCNNFSKIKVLTYEYTYNFFILVIIVKRLKTLFDY